MLDINSRDLSLLCLDAKEYHHIRDCSKDNHMPIVLEKIQIQKYCKTWAIIVYEFHERVLTGFRRPLTLTLFTKDLQEKATK